MRIFVFGNPDISMDSGPLLLLPSLRTTFPEISFETLDPNEEWEVPHHMHIIDTVVGIDAVTVFQGLDRFMKAPRMTCHDFDAYANLLLLRKLGKIDDVTIIGVPPAVSEEVRASVVKEVERLMA
jgi:hypothetical protein